MKVNDAIFGAVLLLLGVVILVHVQGFPNIPGQKYGPGLYPGTAAAGLAVCGLLLIVQGLRERKPGARWFEVADWVGSPRHALAFLAIVGGTIAMILWTDDLGFLLLAPVVLFVWLIALRVRPPLALLIAITVSIGMWYVFYKLLRVPLPWGLLQRWAF